MVLVIGADELTSMRSLSGQCTTYDKDVIIHTGMGWGIFYRDPSGSLNLTNEIVFVA